MNETRGEFPPALQGDIVVDGSDTPLTSVPSEAIDILGSETCLAIESNVATLEQLAELAGTENPFIDRSRSSEVDLSILKPAHAEIVKNYGTTSKPFKGFRSMQVSSFGRKVDKKLPKLSNNMLERCDHAAYCLRELQIEVVATDERLEEKGAESSVVEILRSPMENAIDTAQRIPSRASYQTVENAYLAVIAADELRIENYSKTPIGGKLGAQKMIMNIIEETKLRLYEYRKVKDEIDYLSGWGTKCFAVIIEAANSEQMREVASLIRKIRAAKNFIPNADQLEESETQAVLTAERYLTNHVETVVAATRRTAPDILDKKAVKEDLKNLSTPYLAKELQAREVQRKRNEVGVDVIASITQAKNVLRGGGRLKPGKGQTKKEIQQKAQDLHDIRYEDDRLLEREESGVIIAAVSGHFDSFRRVVEKVKLHTSNSNTDAFPADRSSAIKEIREFGLEDALQKISGIIENPDRSPYIERVLKPEEMKILRTKIKEVLEPEKTDSTQ